jgi:hypothetical protein
MLDEKKDTHYSDPMAARLALDEDQIVADYEAGESAYGIAKRLGVSHYALWSRLKKLGVEMRSSTEQIRMRARKNANHVQIGATLGTMLDGLLLSDASLSFNRPRTTASLRMEQRPDRQEWLELLRREGRKHGLDLRIDTVHHKPSWIGNRRLPGGRYLALRSLNYVELAEQRRRWYPAGGKRVPRDLVLTPSALLHWFCGDGKGGDRKGTLGFCTDDFPKEDVEFLVERLQEHLGIPATVQQSGVTSKGRPRFQVLVGRRDAAHHVQELLGDLLPSCFFYKMQHVRPRSTTGRGRKLSDHDITVIQKLPRTPLSTAVEAAARQGVAVSKTTVWRLWNKK